MIEIPEARTLARQLADTLTGKTITAAQAGASPHGFAWYTGDPAAYGDLLRGCTVTGTAAYGGRPEIWAEDMRISFGDGVNIRYLAPGAKRPLKHQLLLEFDDDSAVVCTVQMYGGIFAFLDATNDDPYYLVGREKPSPLEPAFDAAYFASLLAGQTGRVSAKAFLATEQRIPGLGNGVLQDILWTAGVHPKRKLMTLDETARATLFEAVRTVLAAMTAGGGRSTEKDLYGAPGGYPVVLSRDTVGLPCPRCGTPIARLAYLGGNVYVCRTCQPVE
ncbi:MAG: hypothetical protein LBI33_10805 [Propionibacteriaceae bacterium]|jgi:formamidopyrimidine-DNA glycosylase|nr:hypothetical protein [Propionibacteriaceae bacterium]